MNSMIEGRGGWWLRRTLVPAIGIGALALAGCASSGGSGGAAGAGAGGPAAAHTGSASSGKTVTISSGNVLANAAGRALYVNDQENGTVLCKSSACTAIWIPLTVGAGNKPTGPSKLSGSLTTVKRPDGTTQVALHGKPLYTFSFDHSAGQVTGNGKNDSFDGTNFSWHAATAGGSAPAPASSPAAAYTPPANGGGYNYG